MTEWAPATDAEVAMRDALRTDDQESYFRILAGIDLLLPVSADALAGLAPLGWGTWSTGGRTHVLAFTSPSALQACLADYTGSARRVAYAELADTWPNLEWWLAVNPGLPIEGYLPAWFVAQLSRGDLRLPTRGPVREGGKATQNAQDPQAAVMAANPAGVRDAQGPADGPAGFSQVDRDIRGGSAQSGGPRYETAEASAFGGSADAPAFAGAAGPSPGAGGSRYSGPEAASDQNEGSRFADSAEGSGPGFSGVAGDPGERPVRAGSGADSGFGRDGSIGDGPPRGDAGPWGDGGPVGPGGLPIRTPGAVLPSGLPSRVPAAPMSGPDTPSFSGFNTRGGSEPSPVVPAAYQPPEIPGISPVSAAPRSSVPAADVPAADGWPEDQGVSSDRSPGRGVDSGGLRGPGSPVPPMQDPPGRLPTRTPMAQIPPLPSHIPPPDADRDAAGPESAGGLPRRPVTPLSERPSSMAAAARALAGERGQSVPPPSSIVPPVVPGTGRPARASTVPAVPLRPDLPNTPPHPAAAAGAESGQFRSDQRRSDQIQADPVPSGQPQPEQNRPGQNRLEGDWLQQDRPDLDQFAQQQPEQDRPEQDRSDLDLVEQDELGQDQLGQDEPARDGLAQDDEPSRDELAQDDEPARDELAQDDEPARDKLAQVQPEPDRVTPESTGQQMPPDQDFAPANDVERDLLDAADEGSTDRFLSTLLLATVLVPVEHNSRPGSSPGESGFVFRTEQIEDERFLVVFTSRDRLAEHFAEPTRTVGVRFYELIRNWPDPAWSFAVNPDSPVGAKYPGPQVIALASWAAEAGLGADPADVEDRAIAPVPAPQKVNDAAQHATVMQKTVPAEQVDYYLDRGYDRVAGFVHRASEVEHLRTPAELFGALGLVHDGSPYQVEAKEAYVLRWPAYRPSLYRIPYGGQSEQALRAMDGWVIERPPFRGNGFAPGEGRDVIAEFKVDSVRLPHGAQLWRMDADGTERMIAIFDCDAPIWRRVGEQ